MQLLLTHTTNAKRIASDARERVMPAPSRSRGREARSRAPRTRRLLELFHAAASTSQRDNFHRAHIGYPSRAGGSDTRRCHAAGRGACAAHTSVCVRWPVPLCWLRGEDTIECEEYTECSSYRRGSY